MTKYTQLECMAELECVIHLAGISFMECNLGPFSTPIDFGIEFA